MPYFFISGKPKFDLKFGLNSILEEKNFNVNFSFGLNLVEIQF